MSLAVEGYNNVNEQANTYDDVMRIIRLLDSTALGIIHNSVHDDMSLLIKVRRANRFVRFADEASSASERGAQSSRLRRKTRTIVRSKKC